MAKTAAIVYSWLTFSYPPFSCISFQYLVSSWFHILLCSHILCSLLSCILCSLLPSITPSFISLPCLYFPYLPFFHSLSWQATVSRFFLPCLPVPRGQSAVTVDPFPVRLSYMVQGTPLPIVLPLLFDSSVCRVDQSIGATPRVQRPFPSLHNTSTSHLPRCPLHTTLLLLLLPLKERYQRRM